MKKYSLLNKSTALLLTLGLSVSLFTGCQSKKAAAGGNQTSGAAAQANGNNRGGNNFNGQRPNADELKTRMEENIKSLVTDGTITQSQADKIVEALTQNPGGFGGQRRSGDNQQNNGQNGQQNNQGNNNQNGSQNSNQNGQRNNNGGQNGQRNNALSQLVSDGVITQAKADAVMQKIRGNFTRPQNPQNSQSKQSS